MGSLLCPHHLLMPHKVMKVTDSDESSGPMVTMNRFSRACRACGSPAPPKLTRSKSWSESSAASYETAIIGEAHGLVTDMLADSSLPPHIVSGLGAVSNLLKPPENHSHVHKPKVSPLVSLTESSSYGSDSEDLPYTGERPSSLPKRLRRSLPPSLIRRMSTSTWTTTTSATGMPTLEPEPCRLRSSSFRHPRDSTPSSSPTGSRSNSPSPSSPTTVTLTIPKSRSFSVASPSTHNLPPSQKRLVRKSVGFAPLNTDLKPDTFKPVSPLVGGDGVHTGDSSKTYPTSAKDAQSVSVKRLNVTSDYESNDSPSSSDHSDNVLTGEDLVGSPPKKLICRNDINPLVHKPAISSSSEPVAETEEKGLVCDVVASPGLQDSGQEGDGDDEREESVQPEPVRRSSLVDTDTAHIVSQIEDCALLQIHRLQEWDYPIFELADLAGDYILSKVAYKLFMEVGLFETFRIPVPEFLHYFHALEMGYRKKPYHNCVHATDVLQGVYFLTTQPIPGFQQITTSDTFGRQGSSSESECETERSFLHRPNFLAEDSYGIMGGNFPALELMACYTAAAMHDYDHPGRTNAFLVATHAPQAILYNDRSVLENHHAAAAWNLFLSNPKHNFLSGLDKAEFKRFRFLVIENILATDLKRHFEILAEFNAKVNEDESPGIDWTLETDRLLAMQMAIKLADINGPCKTHNLHVNWTMRISEEFYEQGDEEAKLGMPISPYMDRKNAQLCKLQESFINHLVAPLCNAMVTGGLVPGTWVDEESDGDASGTDTDKGDSTCKDTEDELTDQESTDSPPITSKKLKSTRKVNCLLTKNLKDNHEYWVARLKEEEMEKSAGQERDVVDATDSDQSLSEEEMVPSLEKVTEMETIKEEVETVNGKPESPS
ncbi:LOW QUALITY PROTEIN: cGMP-inhibited 3',5'-cyclic phosphodiesterase 3A-like [Liolophura sinensis]|uniref:LOW QUALITY PROTEIN: cGMP-inhibited 3',5'-cyclic phosphodiesterase 3A-like n=1 Tax=Liolophura sinensis TaxID=3198878 RepID=UPI0031587F16